MNQLDLRPVTDQDRDVRQLYQLLQRRVHSISHQQMPDYGRHREFVLHHPYRVWLFVDVDGELSGTVYLMHDNFIGINLLTPKALKCVGLLIDRIKSQYEPLPAIPSVRAGAFMVNVSPSDAGLSAALEESGAVLIQHTYRV